MKDFFKMFGASLCALIVWACISGFFVFFFFFVIMVSMTADQTSKTKDIKKHSVLKLDLSKAISERGYTDYSSIYNSLSVSDIQILGLNDICSAIDAAAYDSNIEAIYVNLESAGFPDMATAKAIRDRIMDFRQVSGKPVYAYSSGYGNLGYYLASACDVVAMAPMGDFELRGLYSEVMYYKDALQKFGIDVQVVRHGKFKAAVEPFLLSSMSDENRLQIQTYMNDCWDVISEAICQSRNISRDILDGHTNTMDLYSNDRATLESGLVDTLLYSSGVINLIASDISMDSPKIVEPDDINYVTVPEYLQSVGNSDVASNPSIAVIYAVGEIVSSKSGHDSFTSKELVSAIDDVMNDPKIKAVVLRVNSPGGSAYEAEVIYSKLLELVNEKPLVVSMGGYAASGGYYISAPADCIVAEPNTITGSIGVFGLMMSPEKLLNNTLGINVESVSTHRNSAMGGSFKTLPQESIDIYQKSVENVYSTFVQHVADGREMTFDQVDNIAQGRVWTGKSAMEIGLVDTLGGLDVALQVAADIADVKSYNVKEFPEQKDELEQLLSDLMEVSARVYHGDVMYQQMRLVEDIKRRTGVQAYLPKSRIY